MNQINETIAIIRRQKQIYNKQLDKAKSKTEKIEIHHKILLLAREEEKLLKQTDVKL